MSKEHIVITVVLTLLALSSATLGYILFKCYERPKKRKITQ